MTAAYLQADIPVTHPVAHPVTTLTAEQSGRNDGPTSAVWETTIWGPSPDNAVPAPGTARRTA